MLTSSVIIRQAYARIGAWLGTSQEINAAYNVDTAFEQIINESFPPQAMYDMLTGVEGEMATAIAMNSDNVLRSVIYDTITTISGANIPDVSDGGFPVIGVWGQVRDVDTATELTPGLHEDEVRAIVKAPTGIFNQNYYSYIQRPPRIYATVTNIIIDVCVFDYETRAAAIAANGALLFQSLQDMYFDGLMSNLGNEDSAYSTLADQFIGRYQAWLAAQNPPGNPIEAAAA